MRNLSAVFFRPYIHVSGSPLRLMLRLTLRSSLRLLQMFTLPLVLAACTVAIAPAAAPLEVIATSAQYFGPRPNIPAPEQVHALSEQQQRDFLEFFHSPAMAAEPAHWRVERYLDRLVEGFVYRNDTLTATEVMANNTGNCLSLAIMTTALAHLAGVGTAYQLIDSEPVFEFKGTVVEKGVHVRSLLLNPAWQPGLQGVFVSQGITIDYFPSQRERFIRNLQLNDYVAMYYRNVANEALRGNDLNRAYWYAREALDILPDNSEALNTLAIVSRRAGQPAIAEAIYLHAIELGREKLSLLKNYKVLLIASGRHEEAARVDLQLRQMDDPSPFNWLQLARSSFAEEDFESAIAYYRRALERAPYMHEAYLEIARSYQAMGETSQAAEALQQAIARAGRNSDRQFYKAKMVSFQNAP